MAHIKTAVSLPGTLLERADVLAHELSVTRSRLVGRALEEFIRNHESRKLLEEINAACDDLPTPAENQSRRGTRHKHRELVEDQW